MAKITMMGRYSTGKRTITAAFTGQDREALVSKQSRWISQMKGSKDNIQIQGLPEEHGRMSAYRQRLAAIQESDAFIVVLRNDEPVHFEYYHELAVETLADKAIPMGPWMVIAGYITDAVPEVNPVIEQWAKSINATVELVNISKLSNKDEAEKKKLDSIIQSFSASITTAPKEVPKKVEKAENAPPRRIGKPTIRPASTLPRLMTQPAPTLAPTVIVAKKEEKVVSAKMEPKPSAVSRALTYLTRGGSVA